MLLENQELFLKAEENGKLIFQNEEGKEIIVDRSFLSDELEQKNIFMSLDKKPISLPQQLLNEILESEE